MPTASLERVAPYQLKHRGGGRVDILPVGENVAPGGRLNLGDGFTSTWPGSTKWCRTRSRFRLTEDQPFP